MPDDNPTPISFFQNCMQKFDRMHIFCFPNIDNILIFNKSTKDFKECCKIKQLWWYIQITISNSGYHIAI